MKNQIKKIKPATWCMLLIFMLSFLSIGYQIILKNVIIDKLQIKTEWIDKTATMLGGKSIFSPEDLGIDWAQRYPFLTEPTYEQIVLTSDQEATETDIVDRFFSQFEKYASSWYMFRDQCEWVSKRFGKMLGMNLISDSYGNNIIQLRDGRYTAERVYKDVSGEAQNTIAFADYLQKRGIQYFHVALPSPVSVREDSDLVFRGYQEYTNEMADNYINQVEKAGIQVLDIRDLLWKDGISYSEVFFTGDHHMLPEYGCWTAEKIAEEIDHMLGTSANSAVFAPENYRREISKHIYTGSQTMTLSPVYAQKDDMELWYPQFETDIEKNVLDIGYSLTGKFEDVMYDRTMWPSYNVWNHGIRAIKTYKNNLLPDGNTRILLLTESYSDVISPFLVCAYPNIHEIDLRCFSGSLESYIEEYDPDLVVTVYSAYDFDSRGNASSHLYDFS